MSDNNNNSSKCYSNINNNNNNNSCNKHHIIKMEKNTSTIIFLIILLITASLLSIMLGSVRLNVTDILQCLIGRDKSSVTYILIMNIRIPRTFGAIIAGMGLSVAGVILQSVMNNALASPNTIGVNSGAGFFCNALAAFISEFSLCRIICCIHGCTAYYFMYICSCVFC